MRARTVGEEKEEEYINELLQPILDEAVTKIKDITIGDNDKSK